MIKLIFLDPKLSDLFMNKLKKIFFYWKTEPVYVAKYWENL